MRFAGVVTLLAILALAASGAQAGRQEGTTIRATVNSHLRLAIMVTAQGRTLYTYTADIPGRSNCVDDAKYHCSRHWHPLLTTSSPHVGLGGVPKLSGTIKRPNGSLQVTYRQHPLYTFVGGYPSPADKTVGDINGQGAGGSWWIIDPTGAIVHKKPAP